MAVLPFRFKRVNTPKPVNWLWTCVCPIHFVIFFKKNPMGMHPRHVKIPPVSLYLQCLCSYSVAFGSDISTHFWVLIGMIISSFIMFITYLIHSIWERTENILTALNHGLMNPTARSMGCYTHHKPSFLKRPQSDC